jgi:rhomboid protease GluP
MLNKFKEFPLTYSIIGINVVIYIISSLLSHNIADMDMKVLASMGALFGPYVVFKGEWWRLFTSIFLHAGMMHILMNMFSLYLIGRGLEMYFEKKAYILIYVFSGLLGAMASLYMHPQSLGIGASGAIFGIFGALAGFFLANKDKIESQSKAFMKDFAIVLGINLVLGLSMPSIDVSAHIGGLVIGFIGGFIVSKNSKFIWIYSVLMIGLMLLVGNYLSSYYLEIFV